jgi:tRNA U34 5-methylaminomethyl-2-thiouridine-forming methyltransferase MnmC
VPWIPQQTADGSYTFFSEPFGETFHSRDGARDEAFQKYAVATQLADRAQADRICLLDICYGLGYNSAAAIESIWAINPQCQIQLYALELDPTVPIAATQPPLIDAWTPTVQQILIDLAQTHQSHSDRLTATLLIGDARQTIHNLVKRQIQADAIFFDPFSPRRCPQLWTLEFLSQTAQCLAPQGQLATYSRSAAIRAALLQTGLHIGTIPLDSPTQTQTHNWSQGTIAAFDPKNLTPLSPMEQEHLTTRAAIPLRDPSGQDSTEQILDRQQQEQNGSDRESTSSWRRRWNIH